MSMTADLVSEARKFTKYVEPLPHDWEFCISAQSVLTRPSNTEDDEEILVITSNSRGELTCEIKSVHFPDWAIDKIRDLQSQDALDLERLTSILRDAFEDLEDIKELAERSSEEEVYDWDEVKHGEVPT